MQARRSGASTTRPACAGIASRPSIRHRPCDERPGRAALYKPAHDAMARRDYSRLQARSDTIDALADNLHFAVESGAPGAAQSVRPLLRDIEALQRGTFAARVGDGRDVLRRAPGWKPAVTIKPLIDSGGQLEGRSRNVQGRRRMSCNLPAGSTRTGIGDLSRIISCRSNGRVEGDETPPRRDEARRSSSGGLSRLLTRC